jgi:hypothetical protein
MLAYEINVLWAPARYQFIKLAPLRFSISSKDRKLKADVCDVPPLSKDVSPNQDH